MATLVSREERKRDIKEEKGRCIFVCSLLFLENSSFISLSDSNNSSSFGKKKKKKREFRCLSSTACTIMRDPIKTQFRVYRWVVSCLQPKIFICSSLSLFFFFSSLPIAFSRWPNRSSVHFIYFILVFVSVNTTSRSFLSAILRLSTFW